MFLGLNKNGAWLTFRRAAADLHADPVSIQREAHACASLKRRRRDGVGARRTHVTIALRKRPEELRRHIVV